MKILVTHRLFSETVLASTPDDSAYSIATGHRHP